MLIVRHRCYTLPMCFLFSVALALAVGCGETTSTVATNAQAVLPATQAAVEPSGPTVAPSLDQALVGQWLGQAIIDEEVLEEKLVGLPPAQQEAIVLSAENFLSTVMAIDFRNDGTVESEVEITPLGQQPLRDNSFGQWRVSKVDDEQLLVETTELAEDGTTSISQKTFRFYPDRNAFVMSVPVSAELQGCDALMIFERQSAVVNVAQQPTGTQQK